MEFLMVKIREMSCKRISSVQIRFSGSTVDQMGQGWHWTNRTWITCHKIFTTSDCYRKPSKSVCSCWIIMCMSRQLWYSGLDSSRRNTWQTEYDKEYTNGTGVQMHAVTFLTAVSIPSLTTILEHISAVHPLLFVMSFFPLTATIKPVQKFSNAKLAY
jgi:hypothetical protein